MNLLKNAVESIKLGVEDFQQGSDSRLLSSVRNIHAGILLLYKESLRRLSPEGSEDALLKSKIIRKPNNDGNIIFVGAGKNTVSVRQIKKRFKILSIKTDWKRFDKISEVRNDIEHHYTLLKKGVLQGVIANACVILRDFMDDHFEEDPMKLLGPTTWGTMLQIEEIYLAERKKCDDAMHAIRWYSDALAEGVREITCLQCGSDLLFPKGESTEYNEITLCCRECGAEKSPESFIPNAIQTALAHDMYLSHTDGGETPYTACPSCLKESYVMEEQRCASCDHHAEHKCRRCHHTIPAGEMIHEPYCGSCAHMISKDDY